MVRKKQEETCIKIKIKEALLRHPKVVWAHVTTTGLLRRGGRWITVGKKSMPDIVGQLKTGQLLGIEVKRPGEEPEEGQFKFIDMIIDNGGVAGWARSVEEAMEVLE